MKVLGTEFSQFKHNWILFHFWKYSNFSIIVFIVWHFLLGYWHEMTSDCGDRNKKANISYSKHSLKSFLLWGKKMILKTCLWNIFANKNIMVALFTFKYLKTIIGSIQTSIIFHHILFLSYTIFLACLHIILYFIHISVYVYLYS